MESSGLRNRKSQVRILSGALSGHVSLLQPRDPQSLRPVVKADEFPALPTLQSRDMGNRDFDIDAACAPLSLGVEKSDERIPCIEVLVAQRPEVDPLASGALRVWLHEPSLGLDGALRRRAQRSESPSMPFGLAARSRRSA